MDKEVETVNHLLISPLVLHSKFLPNSWKARIDYSDALSPDNEKIPHDEDNTDQVYSLFMTY